MDLDQTKTYVTHSGDCSIYGYGRDICDCGALRRKMSSGEVITNATESAWVKHVGALLRSHLGGRTQDWRIRR